jgi:predicted PurR-regulated permease PerM
VCRFLGNSTVVSVGLNRMESKVDSCGSSVEIMSWLGWVAVAIFVVLALVILVLYKAVKVLGRTVDELVVGLDHMRSQTLPLLQETRTALKRSEGSVNKADALLDVATSLTSTADSATRLAYRVVTNPFVKVLSWFTGTKAAASRLRMAVEPDGPVVKRIQRADESVKRTKRRRNSIETSGEEVPDRPMLDR